MHKEATPFFNQILDASISAEKTSNAPIHSYFKIGNLTLQLSFPNTSMVSAVTSALKHLEIHQPDSIDLQVHVWDTVSTAISPPPCPWDENAWGAKGEIHGFLEEGILTAAYVDPAMLSTLNMFNHQAVFWIRDYRDLPTYELAAPLKIIIHWWTRLYQYTMVHAAAISVPKGAILLAGKGGSGKSTTALTCILNGWSYLGDDYCLLISNNQSSIVYSLYNSIKIHQNLISRFPSLSSSHAQFMLTDKEKRIYFMHETPDISIIQQQSLKAILIPRVTNRSTTRLLPASPIDTLRALAPSSMFQLPYTSAEDFYRLSSSIQHLPAYHLELGPDFDRIPHVILSEIFL